MLTDEDEVSVVSLNKPLSFDSDAELTDKELSDFVSSDSSNSLSLQISMPFKFCSYM